MNDNSFGRAATLIRGGWFKLLDGDGKVIMEGNQPEVIVPVQVKEIDA